MERPMKKRPKTRYYRKSEKNYYAVAVGRQPGIYRTWPECKEMVHRYSGAIFKGFKTHQEAVEFFLVNKEDDQEGEFKHVPKQDHQPCIQKPQDDNEAEILIDAINRIGTF